MAKLMYADYYLPNHTVSVLEYLKSQDIVIPKIYKSKEEYSKAYVKRTKLEFFYEEKERDLIEIFTDMLTRLFEINKIDPTKIRYVFYTKSYRSYYSYHGDGEYHGRDMGGGSVNIPYYLTGRFGLEEACVIVNDGKCASVLQALELSAMCCDKKGGYGLILTPSFSKSNNRYRDTTLFGDGVGIMLVGDDRNSGYEIIDSLLKTDGMMSWQLYDNYIKECQGYGEKSKKPLPLLKFEDVFEHEVLNRNGLTNDAVKGVITLNIKVLIDRYSKVYPGRVYQENVPYGGHISDVDLIRNFKDFTSKAPVEKGEHMLLISCGADTTGMEYGGVLLKG